ncbi:predicted protein [Histoplasma capsulatum G186AR]|uniref:Uncharacterized protein n=2 Tax=Ajellomyces capsulatus TaxID=5037 RepID=C0NWP2_AJECG|nr:uncharacterized protein HCBG_07572 [Histoplasma capsulatum G186AR]EEH04347.1 predicted protein [Histoplasma capsulatum G186AR]KAG5291306.1 hypothetical protein I7I52_08593 [Histoplasma capsulatum]QSS68609.1 hypothetical protein I7I50_08077 [Histoplasma capsulatum G186AR]
MPGNYHNLTRQLVKLNTADVAQAARSNLRRVSAARNGKMMCLCFGTDHIYSYAGFLSHFLQCPRLELFGNQVKKAGYLSKHHTLFNVDSYKAKDLPWFQ